MAEKPAKKIISNPGEALSYIPAILIQLNNNGKDMFAVVLQGMLDTGYANG